MTLDIRVQAHAWLTQLAKRTERIDHFASPFTYADVEVHQLSRTRYSVYFYDPDGQRRSIDLNVDREKLTVIGPTGSFHDTSGNCPPLTLTIDP